MYWIKNTAFILALFVCASSVRAEGIEFFHGTWQEALEEAQNQGKIVFVDAYTTWCGPCKRMSKNVFTQDKVGSYFNENFVNIKIDMEKPNGREFGAKYPVSAYPTLFFLEPTGKLIKKSVGGKQVDQLVSLGVEVVSKFDYSAEERKLYEDGDRTFSTVLGYINGLNKSGKSSLKVANDYLLSEHGMTDAQETKFLFEAATEVDSKIFEEMLARKSKVIAMVGADAFQARVVIAAERTAEKSIMYEDDSLMKLAFSAVKKSGSSNYKFFVADSKMKLAASEKNEKAYLKAAKVCSKRYTTLDEKIRFCQRIQSEYKENKKVDEMQLEYLRNSALSADKKEQIDLYVKLLMGMEKYNEVIDYANLLLKNLTDQATINYVNSIIKVVEKQKAS